MSFRVNVSAILSYQRCPTEWYHRYVLRRVPRGMVHYFESGKYWHSLMSLAAASGLQTAIATAPELMTNLLNDASADPDVSPDSFAKFKDEIERLTLLLPHVPPFYLLQSTISIEQELSAIIPPFDKDVTLFGRPDEVILTSGKFWHRQHKTVSDRTSIPVYIAQAERSLHELAYAWLICGSQRISFAEYGGTDLNIVRKLSRKACGERPREAFVQEFVPIRESQVRDALDDIAAIAADMQAILAGEKRLIQNRVADTNRFGNVLSPYWDCRSGATSITDERFYRTLPPDSYESPLASDGDD